MPQKKALTGLWIVAGIMLGVFLGWLVVRDVSWVNMQSALSRVSWDALIPAVSAVIVSLILQAIRWKLLLPGESVSTGRLFLVRNVGLSVNNLMVARGILGEASELAMLTKSDKIAGSKVVASIYVTRALDFLVTSAFVLVGFVVIPQLSVFKPVMIPMLVATASFSIILLAAKHISRFPLLKKIKAIESSLHAIAFLRNRQANFWLSISLTISAWMLLGTAAWLVAQALGILLPFWMISILLVGVGLLSGFIPSGPSSLGVYEFATVHLLGLFAIDKSDALSFAVLIHALIVFPTLIIGIPMLSRERKTFGEIIGQASGLLNRWLPRRGT